MFSTALRRTAIKRSHYKPGLFSVPSHDISMIWAEQKFMRGVEGDTTPVFIQYMKREKLATFSIAATAAYVGYAYSRPHKDSKLFDSKGDLYLPILTPFMRYLDDRIGATTITYPGVDPFEHFTEEEKQERMETLKAAGFFDRYWQDQGDDWDRYRLMTALTQKAIVEKFNNVTSNPEAMVYTLDEVAEEAARMHSKQPVFRLPYGDRSIPILTPVERHASSIVNALRTGPKSKYTAEEYEKLFV